VLPLGPEGIRKDDPAIVSPAEVVAVPPLVFVAIITAPTPKVDAGAGLAAVVCTVASLNVIDVPLTVTAMMAPYAALKPVV
jgi:hypothetical protein